MRSRASRPSWGKHLKKQHTLKMTHGGPSEKTVTSIPSHEITAEEQGGKAKKMHYLKRRKGENFRTKSFQQVPPSVTRRTWGEKSLQQRRVSNRIKDAQGGTKI